jgi:hypothetical protein
MVGSASLGLAQDDQVKAAARGPAVLLLGETLEPESLSGRSLVAKHGVLGCGCDLPRGSIAYGFDCVTLEPVI